MKQIFDIPIDEIDVKSNIRISDKSVTNLMESIKQHGLQEPIKVKKVRNGKYELIFGSRRLEACKKLGHETIESIVTEDMDENDQVIINAIENLQRKNNSPIEIGRICVKLREMGLNNKEISIRLGIHEKNVSVYRRLFQKIPEKYKDKVVHKENNYRKNEGISVAIANTILNEVGETKLIPKKTFEEVFEIVHMDKLNAPKIYLLSRLLKAGKNLKEAYGQIDQYESFRLEFAFNKNDLQELRKIYPGYNSKKAIFAGILNGEIKERIRVLGV